MTAKVEERDRRIKLLERIIHYDTQIFTKMKYAIRYDKMATKMNDAEQKRSSHKQNKVLEPYYISSKDYEIEFPKEVAGTFHAMKHINVEIINAELANCNTTIANLKILFTENADQLKQIIIVLGKHNSTLEDQIEEIKADHENLRVRHQLIEEEKRMAVEAMKTELELLYLET